MKKITIIILAFLFSVSMFLVGAYTNLNPTAVTITTCVGGFIIGLFYDNKKENTDNDSV